MRESTRLNAFSYRKNGQKFTGKREGRDPARVERFVKIFWFLRAIFCGVLIPELSSSSQVPSNLIVTPTSIAADQNWIPYLTSKRSSHQQTQFEAKESKINLHFRDLDRLRLCRYEVFLSTNNPYKTVRKNK